MLFISLNKTRIPLNPLNVGFAHIEDNLIHHPSEIDRRLLLDFVNSLDSVENLSNKYFPELVGIYVIIEGPLYVNA